MKVSIRTTLFLLGSILGLATTAWTSQSDDKLDNAAWNYLTTLAPDQEIRVELKDGKKLKGKAQLLTDDGIVVRIAGKDSKLTRDSIRRVLVKGDSHRSRNAAIGGFIGGLIGLGIGAAIPSGGWEEIYRAPEAPPTPLPHAEEKRP
jgi:hypothetical protein